jgi:flagellar P-ring protein FlgI
MIKSILAFVVLGLSVASAHSMTRIKDITSVKDLRAHQLIGYGLVVGLNGTGDGLRNAPFTQQSIQSMLDRMGINIRNGQARTRNVAAVIVTAELPPFVSRGGRIDVTVASLGDATSLVGGALLMTPLSGADNVVYAVAQGPVAVTGFAAAGKAESVTQGVPTTGRIANGAMIEQSGPMATHTDAALEIELRNPDFKTAVAIADAINTYGRQRFGVPIARVQNYRTVRLEKPRKIEMARFIAEFGDLSVEPDVPARVVIDERTGTIVIGNKVQISTVAVTHGTLTVRVSEQSKVSQPSPFSAGETVIVPETELSVTESGGNIAVLRGPNLQTLVAGLNRMGLKPNGIVAILQAMKSAGALQAELVVQ